MKNLELYGEYVKLLGLGGTYALDFVNTSVPRLRVLQEDFVSFGGSIPDCLLSVSPDDEQLHVWVCFLKRSFCNTSC